MKYGVSKVIPWVGAYVVLVLTPLLLAVVGPVPPPRPFFVEFGVGLGFLGIGIVGLQFVITGRFRNIAPVFGGDVVLQFHRQIGVIGVALILAHPVVLIASDPEYLEFFDPTVNVLRALALSSVVGALVLLLVTSLWRERVLLQYEWWRIAHGVLALAIVFIGMVHGLQVGEHLGAFWKRGLWVGALVGMMYLVVHTRLVRPALMRRRPYRVVEVRREGHDTFTMVIEPDGHVGTAFRAGQYMWMTVGDSPYSMQQHPFSISSSSLDATIAFTAKAVGDFTSTWDDVAPGQRVFLEGPYGAFTLDMQSQGAVFVVGGIGVTPVMSILRTMRDTGDRRPVVMFYADSTVDDIVFRDELDDLAADLDLRVVHVIESPPDDWTGESGFVDREVIERSLPAACRNFEFFVCGPEPMMDAAETALRDLGFSWRQIYTERFQIV